MPPAGVLSVGRCPASARRERVTNISYPLALSLSKGSRRSLMPLGKKHPSSLFQACDVFKGIITVKHMKNTGTRRGINSPLWQRGVRGDLSKIVGTLLKKIPLHPPFTKGEIKWYLAEASI